MNKQALAFLTMFSLILMLSVYYVTLPSDSSVVVKEEGKQAEVSKTSGTKNDDRKKDATTKEEPTSKVNKATELQGQINDKQQKEINKNSSIISNKDAKEAVKKEAISVMEELKSEQAIQSELISALHKAGYKTAVEIHDSTCIVSVFESKDTKENAKKVMMEVSKLTNQKYLIEVTFK